MPTNAFIGKATKPLDRELGAGLGSDAKALWDKLVASLTTEFKLDQEWKSSSRKAGWSLRLKAGARNIVYLVPYQGCIGVAFALGDKAVKAALQSGLPEALEQAIHDAPRYAEGTGLRIEVHGDNDIASVKTLVRIKLQN
jgi:hypothetical protein